VSKVPVIRTRPAQPYGWLLAGWHRGGVFQSATASRGAHRQGGRPVFRKPLIKGRPEMIRPPGGVLGAMRRYD